jgi:integrase/recombinase XerD
MLALRVSDVVLGTSPFVHILGKGRNYDDLAIMHSSAPRTPVWLTATGVWSRVPVVDCA